MAKTTIIDYRMHRNTLIYKGAWAIGLLLTLAVITSKAIDGYVVIRLNDDPPAYKLAATALGYLFTLLGPGGLYFFMERRFRRFTRDFADRLTRVEAMIDPGRTSSGLREDGTDPRPGGKP